MKLSEEAGRYLTRRRATRQWSLRRAAQQAGTSVGTWQRAEGGQEIEYASLVRIVSALGLVPVVADLLAQGRIPGDDPDGGGAVVQMPDVTAVDLDEDAASIQIAALAGQLTPAQKARVQAYIQGLLDSDG